MMEGAALAENVCEEKVFKALFNTMSRSLRDFIYYKSGDLDSANDIMQDAFFKLWEKCKDVPYEKAKSFIFTTANHLFLNGVKSQKVRLKYRQSNPNSSSHKEDPAYEMEMNEFKAKLEEAIANLPEGQREVFLLNRINKMTYKEIATSLGVSQKAIEKRMSKALIKLKDVLHPKK